MIISGLVLVCSQAFAALVPANESPAQTVIPMNQNGTQCGSITETLTTYIDDARGNVCYVSSYTYDLANCAGVPTTPSATPGISCVKK